MNDKMKLVGRVEFYDTPKGVDPKPGVDKPFDIKEVIIPLNAKFNTIFPGSAYANSIKKYIASWLGTVKNATSSTTEVDSGDVRIGSTYKVKTAAITMDGVAYPEDAILVATAETYTGSGKLILIWDNYDLAHNLFADNNAFDSGDEGEGGIGCGVAAAGSSLGSFALSDKFITSVNVVGDDYVEMRGYYDVGASPKTFQDWLVMGTDFLMDAGESNQNFDNVYAYVSVSESVAAERRFSVYWKISIT